MKHIIGYEYESALGKRIRKLVICKDDAEYQRMKRKIEDAYTTTLLEFDDIYNASQVLKGE